MKLFENFTNREWEPRDSAPPKQSHKFTYLCQLSRLRVIAKACTPQTSRNIIHLTACGVQHSHNRSVLPLRVSTCHMCVEKRFGIPKELRDKPSACKLNHIRIFAGLVFTQYQCLLTTTVIRSGYKHDNSCRVQVR